MSILLIGTLYYVRNGVVYLKEEDRALSKSLDRGKTCEYWKCNF